MCLHFVSSIAYLQADGCLVSLVHDDSDADDEESVMLYKQLCHSAHMEFRVEGLSSGYSKDVHGQVSWVVNHHEIMWTEYCGVVRALFYSGT